MNKISVIIPFYQSKNTVQRCVESLLDQTYPNFEILAVSDGSTDGSIELLQKLAEQDSRLHVIRAEHGGVSHARNVGLSLAEGEFTQFVDSDDYVEPDMLEKMLHELLLQDADICICDYTHPCLHNYAGNRIFDLTKPGEAALLNQTAFAVVVPWNKLFRREVIRENFLNDLHFCEDEMFGIANLFYAKKVVSIKERLYHYCVAGPESGAQSCIVSMVTRPFWKGKESIWYMREALLPISQEILYRHLPREEADEFAYTRMFDFMVWGLAIYCSADADEIGTRIETERILKEPGFLKSLALKKPYGVEPAEADPVELSRRVRLFVSLSFTYHKTFGNDCDTLRHFYVYLALYARLFLRASDTVPLNKADCAAEMLDALRHNSTPEARYANTVLDECEAAEAEEQTA